MRDQKYPFRQISCPYEVFAPLRAGLISFVIYDESNMPALGPDVRLGVVGFTNMRSMAKGSGKQLKEVIGYISGLVTTEYQSYTSTKALLQHYACVGVRHPKPPDNRTYYTTNREPIELYLPCSEFVFADIKSGHKHLYFTDVCGIYPGDKIWFTHNSQVTGPHTVTYVTKSEHIHGLRSGYRLVEFVNQKGEWKL